MRFLRCSVESCFCITAFTLGRLPGRHFDLCEGRPKAYKDKGGMAKSGNSNALCVCARPDGGEAKRVCLFAPMSAPIEEMELRCHPPPPPESAKFGEVAKNQNLGCSTDLGVPCKLE